MRNGERRLARGKTRRVGLIQWDRIKTDIRKKGEREAEGKKRRGQEEREGRQEEKETHCSKSNPNFRDIT